MEHSKAMSISFFLLVFVSFCFAAPSPCGLHGPTQWLNAHISDQVKATIGSPFSARHNGLPHFLEFYGSRNFQGLQGCVFSELSESYEIDPYSSSSAGGEYDWQAAVSYSPEHSLITFMQSDDGSETLEVTYENCLAVGQENEKTVVKRYRQANLSFPNGVEVVFFYDSQCRVKSLQELQPIDNGWQLTYSSNFTYDTEDASIPSSIKSASELAVTLLSLNIEEINANGLITKLTATQRTAQLESDIQIAEPEIESWTFSYDPATSSRLEHAELHSTNLRDEEHLLYHFHHDRNGRWTSVSFTNLFAEEQPREAKVLLKAQYRERAVDVLMNIGGASSRLRGRR